MGHYVKKDVIHKTGSTEHFATPSEQDRTAAAVNVTIKIGEVFLAVYFPKSAN